jgi:hypothetical protein
MVVGLFYRDQKWEGREVEIHVTVSLLVKMAMESAVSSKQKKMVSFF